MVVFLQYLSGRSPGYGYTVGHEFLVLTIVRPLDGIAQHVPIPVDPARADSYGKEDWPRPLLGGESGHHEDLLPIGTN